VQFLDFVQSGVFANFSKNPDFAIFHHFWILLFFTIFGFWVDPAPGLADIKIAPERFSLTNT